MQRLALALAALALSAHAVAQQDWPSRPVTMVNPFAAGSAVDVVARHVAQGMSQNLGKQVVVENRTGASGNIGTEAVARAKPDGSTLLLAASAAISPAAPAPATITSASRSALNRRSGPDQRPLKFGVRFSMNAVRPSL